MWSRFEISWLGGALALTRATNHEISWRRIRGRLLKIPGSFASWVVRSREEI